MEDEIIESEEVIVTDAEELKPKPPTKFAPRGIETFTVCRQGDESGVSGTGVVIEGVSIRYWSSCFALVNTSSKRFNRHF
jgi:hypothetical protein